MTTHIFRSVDEPIRKDPTFCQRWNGPDNGLITCWEVGRINRIKLPELSDRAMNGELPVFAWKGGEKKLKKKEKYGSLNYLAQWQGLRNEDLDIDTSKETRITCIKTGITVSYTGDASKYVDP